MGVLLFLTVMAVRKKAEAWLVVNRVDG